MDSVDDARRHLSQIALGMTDAPPEVVRDAQRALVKAALIPSLSFLDLVSTAPPAIQGKR